MPILPKPYPDEVVGSIVARACRHTGIPMRRLLGAVFESKRSTYSFLLGDSVAHLARQVGHEPLDFLIRHTMFSYAVAFMPATSQVLLTAKALTRRTNEDSLSSLTKNVSHGVPYRRVCMQCIKEDLSKYGESYWHREHLLPGVLVCVRHDKPLLETDVKIRGSAHVSDMVLPHETRNLRPPAASPGDISARIAEISTKALRWELPRSDDWLYFYQERARSRGYVIPSGDIAGALVSSLLRSYFGPGYLDSMGCPVGTEAGRTWPTLMVRPGRVANFATPKHVLMLVFLESGLQHIEPTPAYRAPGRRARDYRQLDAITAQTLRMRIQQVALSGERVTIQKLLQDCGAWAAYRHNRENFIKTAEILRDFKHSDYSERQTGGRPFWKKKLPGRYGKADEVTPYPDAKDRSEQEL